MGVKKELIRDEMLIIVWPIIAALISLAIKANFFVSIILFLILPSVYLSLKLGKFVPKAIIFSAIGLILFIALDYIAVSTGQWYFPHSIMPYRLFDVVAFEGVFWTFCWVYFILIYYEYFLEKKCTPKLYHPSLKYMFIAFSVLLATFLAILFINESILKIPYFYLVFGIVLGIIPIAGVLLRFPQLFTKFAKAAVYFLYFSLVWELIAVPLGQWSFPGPNFIGWIELFGVRFPFEEFFVWMMLGAMAILSWYEFFDDDLK